MDIASRIAQRIDASFAEALGVTNTTAAEPEPLTLDKLREWEARMPPRLTFLSSKLFPASDAMVLRTSREHWAVAHPDFWKTHPFGARAGEIKIINIDVKEGDDERTRFSKNRERKRYADALAWSIRSRAILAVAWPIMKSRVFAAECGA